MTRPGLVLAVVLASASAAPAVAQTLGGVERNTREGAEHFEAGRLEEALRAFSRARDASPEVPENDLNIAGVHYRMGEAVAAPTGAGGAPGPAGTAAAPSGEEGPFAEAVRGYRAALAAGAEGATRRDAYYNLGNTLFRSGAFREAAAAFGEAVALDPEDLEARQNLEQALLRAEEHEQEQREEQDSGGGEQESDEQEPQESESDPSGQPPPDSGEDDRQDPDQPTGSSDPEDESGDEERPPESPGEPPEPESLSEEPGEDEAGSPEEEPSGADTPNPSAAGVPEISPEQAERILAALAEVERRFQEEQLEKRRARALRRGRH